ncbi:GntR family transcriptional regulator [Gammaproteobacteria bacterium]|nr:GntR family transcriptional regulator [Gammaproteobacteria bacterium]
MTGIAHPLSMLNPDSPLPLYQQLADRLLASIRCGEWQVGERIPAETALAELHLLGRPTVRQAIDVLVRRGLLERRRGSGTYVRDASREVDLLSLGGTSAAFAAQGIIVEAQALEPLRAITGNNPLGTSAWAFARCMMADGAPILIERFWLDHQTFDKLDLVLSPIDSLADTVERYYRLRASEATQQFFIQPANRGDALQLDVAPDTPLLAVTRRLHFGTQRHLIHSELVVRTDRFQFTQTLQAH